MSHLDEEDGAATAEEDEEDPFNIDTASRVTSNTNDKMPPPSEVVVAEVDDGDVVESCGGSLQSSCSSNSDISSNVSSNGDIDSDEAELSMSNGLHLLFCPSESCCNRGSCCLV